MHGCLPAMCPWLDHPEMSCYSTRENLIGAPASPSSLLNSQLGAQEEVICLLWLKFSLEADFVMQAHM